MADSNPDIFGPRAPFVAHVDIRRTFREGGVARNELELRPELLNGADGAHGGTIMTMLDTVMANAARSMLGEDHGVMTIDLQTQFLAPGKGKLFGEGRVSRGGKNLFFCEGAIKDISGALVAKGTGVFRRGGRRGSIPVIARRLYEPRHARARRH